MVNWKSVEEEYNNFKNFYEDGTYKVKCKGVKIEEVGDKGSIVQKFEFEETDEGSYPTADHWLSFKNDNWRAWHNKQLMVVLGASEENAKKAVDLCESKKSKDEIVNAYKETYKRLLAKKPEVEIEVYTDGKYVRAEFTDKRVAMPKSTDNKLNKEDTEVIPEDIPDEPISMDNIPF